MITLKNARSLARGSTRDVYAHPFDANALIKIYHQGNTRTARPWSPRREKRRFGPLREWYIEYEEYIALLSRLGFIPDFIAEFRGFCETDRGLGQIVEKITDADSGEMSGTLRDAAGTLPQGDLVPHIHNLFAKIEASGVVFRDLNLANIIAAKDARGGIARLVCVDGLGDFTLVRVRRVSTTAHRLWARRAKRTMLCAVAGLYDEPGAPVNGGVGAAGAVPVDHAVRPLSGPAR